MLEQTLVEQPHIKQHKNSVSAQAVLNGEIKGIKRLLPFLYQLLSLQLLIWIRVILPPILRQAPNMDIFYCG